MEKISSAAFTDTKPHYDLLDGLRGVAALMVIWYHVFEGFAFASAGNIETLNHGYLAVDFFFILSGFVIGYAYDDRWGKNFTMKDFFKRRLIRLHPMVIMGAVLGAITFCIQGCVQWDGTHVAISMIMLSLLCTIFFIPAMPGVGYEVRGNGEMFPLNGPCWSLFFEYIGNILYALFIRRLSNKALAVLVVLLGMALASFAVFNVSGYGNMGVGWIHDARDRQPVADRRQIHRCGFRHGLLRQGRPHPQTPHPRNRHRHRHRPGQAGMGIRPFHQGRLVQTRVGHRPVPLPPDRHPARGCNPRMPRLPRGLLHRNHAPVLTSGMESAQKRADFSSRDSPRIAIRT